MRNILFPKPLKMNFYRDINLYIIILFMVAMIGFFSVLPAVSREIDSKLERFTKLVDTLTICVPPSLPASMNFGIVFALARLKQNEIYSLQSKLIIMAARIKIFVFDKTGTLTEEGMSVMGVHTASSENTFDEEFATDIPAICPKTQEEIEAAHKQDLKSIRITMCMACCHAISELKKSEEEKEIIGDPLDIEMFKSTNWRIDEEDITDTICQRIKHVKWKPPEEEQDNEGL